ncbi:MAG: hypothetical protein MSK40_16865 [Parabacteroides sp.]|nr:hypothetical protein [Parabacteroides sp.]
MEDKGIVSATIQGSFASVASAFVMESLQHMIPWLIVSFFVIMADLAFGVRKSLLLGESVRFSRAVRATMGKIVTYFAFVCAVCMITVAAGLDWKIDVYSCLLVCFIEGCSIIGNILKPKGIRIDMIGALRVLAKKAADVNDEDVKCILKEEKEEEKENH